MVVVTHGIVYSKPDETDLSAAPVSARVLILVVIIVVVSILLAHCVSDKRISDICDCRKQDGS